jgi:hypothetical protein
MFAAYPPFPHIDVIACGNCSLRRCLEIEIQRLLFSRSRSGHNNRGVHGCGEIRGEVVVREKRTL